MKPRPLPDFTLHAQFLVMILDYAVANGEAQAGTPVTRSGGEERFAFTLDIMMRR